MDYQWGDSDGLVIPELGVAPLEDSGTDLVDELPTPDGSLSTDASKLVPGPMPQGVDLELARTLFELGVLPAMVTPIVDLVVETSVTPVLYPVPPIPVLSVVDSAPVLVVSPFRQMGGAQLGISPCRARYRLLAPSLSRSLPRSRRRYGQRILPDRCLAWPRWTSTCRGILCCRWGSPRIPLSCRPRSPCRIIEDLMSRSVVGSPSGCCGPTEYAGFVSGGPL